MMHGETGDGNAMEAEEKVNIPDAIPSPSPGTISAGAASIVGGIVSAGAESSPASVAGLIMSLTGLLAAGLTWYKEYNAAKLRDQRIAEQDRRIAEQDGRYVKLETQFMRSRTKWHKERNDISGEVYALKTNLIEERLKVAKLEGQLDITEEVHRNGINQNGRTLHDVADRVGLGDVPVATIRPPIGKPDVPVGSASGHESGDTEDGTPPEADSGEAIHLG